jgi:hypothetical protein
VRFRVLALLAGTSAGLRDGLQASLAVMTARRRGVPALPIAALVRQGGEDGVFVLEQGRVLFTPVKTGISGETHVEALSGVEEGQAVVVGPFKALRALKDRELVRAREARGGEPAPSSWEREFEGMEEAPAPSPALPEVAPSPEASPQAALAPELAPSPSPSPTERALARLIVPVQGRAAAAPAAPGETPSPSDPPGQVDARLFVGAAPRPSGDRLSGDGPPCVLEDVMEAAGGELLLRFRLAGGAGRQLAGSALAGGRVTGILATDDEGDLRILVQLAPGARGPLALVLDSDARYALERLP